MRPARAMTAVVLPALLVVVGAPRAGAGGSVFDFHDAYVVTGDVVTGSTEFSARVGGSGAGPQDGPWETYLLPGDRWIRPGRLPSQAIRLAPVSITGSGPLRQATVTFTVPDVPAGSYNFAICNVPCTDTALGDLVGGWLTIARTDQEAQLLRARDDLAQRVDRARGRLARRIRGVERPLNAMIDRVDALEESADRRLADLRETVAALPQPEGGRNRLSAVAGWVLAAVVAGAWVVSRRRRTRAPAAATTVEWTVPEERRVPQGVSGRT
jgi:hypothetical protein